MFSKIRFAMKSLSKHDKFMIVCFLFGFIMGVFDRALFHLFKQKLLLMENWQYIFMYIAFAYFLYMTAKLFPRVVMTYRLSGNDSFRKYALKSFAIMAVGFYIGEIVNVANVLTVTFFERYIV